MLTMGVGEGGCGFLEQTQLKPTLNPLPCGKQPGRHELPQARTDPPRPCLPLGKAWKKQIILSGGEHLFHSFFYSFNQCLLDIYCMPGPVIKNVIITLVRTIKEMYTVPEGPIIGIYKIYNQL